MSDIEIDLFSFMDTEHLCFDKVVEEELVKRGYHISAWKQGEMLTEDFGKKDKLTAYNELESGLKKAVLEHELRQQGNL